MSEQFTVEVRPEAGCLTPVPRRRPRPLDGRHPRGLPRADRRRRPRRVVLDLGDLTFLDSAGLNCFVHTHQRFGPELRELLLSQPQPHGAEGAQRVRRRPAHPDERLARRAHGPGRSRLSRADPMTDRPDSSSLHRVTQAAQRLLAEDTSLVDSLQGVATAGCSLLQGCKAASITILELDKPMTITSTSETRDGHGRCAVPGGRRALPACRSRGADRRGPRRRR